MKTLIIGIVIGLVLATVGFSGIARILDNSVAKVQTLSKEAAQ
jgi:uncharacterized membrane protein YtjA (UPF0391 family)